MLLSGAFHPLKGFLSSADAHAVDGRGTLADGTPWPAPVTLTLPDDHPAAPGDQVTLRDPEGVPLAVLTVTERQPTVCRRPGEGPGRTRARAVRPAPP